MGFPLNPLTAVKNYNKSLENCFFFKTESTTKTKCSRPRPRLHDPRPRPSLSFLSSRRLEAKTLVSRTISLVYSYNYRFYNKLFYAQAYSDDVYILFWQDTLFSFYDCKTNRITWLDYYILSSIITCMWYVGALDRSCISIWWFSPSFSSPAFSASPFTLPMFEQSWIVNTFW